MQQHTNASSMISYSILNAEFNVVVYMNG